MTVAEEVMARLTNGNRQVVVVGMPPRNGLDPMALKADAKRRQVDMQEVLTRVKREFDKKLTLEACAVAYDQNGLVVSGSIVVVAAVPTDLEADEGLL